MNRLVESQIGALRSLMALWPERELSLIGAMALACQLPGFHRQTNDLDLSVAISTEELRAGLRKLPGWQRHARKEQEWHAPGGVRVDLIPAGPELLAARSLVWPESGTRMSLVGFRHALRGVHPLALADDLVVSVASVPVVALLKIVAYCDRPFDRERDVGDIAAILELYPEDDDPRRFTDAVIAAGVTFEEANGFLLGKELADMVDGEEKAVLEGFIAWALDETDGGRTQGILLRQAPVAWRGRPEEALSRLRAFRRGLLG